MRRLTQTLTAAILICLITGCDGIDITTPYPKNLAIIKVAGDSQISSPGAIIQDYLVVRVEHVNTKEPVAGILVSWSVLTGDGAEPTPEVVRTDVNGFAATRVRLGTGTGAYIIQARFDGLWGSAPQFTVNAK